MPMPRKPALVSQAAEEPVVGSLHQAMLPTTVTAGPHLIVMLQTLPLSASECHHSEKGSRSVRHGAPRHRREVNARALASPLPFGDHHTVCGRRRNDAGTRSVHDEFSANGPLFDQRLAQQFPVCTQVDDPTYPGCRSSWAVDRLGGGPSCEDPPIDRRRKEVPPGFETRVAQQLAAE